MSGPGKVYPLRGSQRHAVEPEDSVWLSASAGTGKTQVLSARVLRLLLQPGVDPSQVLCLTFTKAGAAEMAVRINEVLARWVRLPDGELFKDLEAIGAPSGPEARAHARGLSNVRFETARAQDFPGDVFDLVTLFDALHDMGDPVGAIRHIAGALAPDGKVMLVEPRAGDALEDNLHPVGRIFYACSTNFCVPASLGQEVGAALGAQAGEKRLAAVLREGGLPRVRRPADNPFNMVLEASF